MTTSSFWNALQHMSDGMVVCGGGGGPGGRGGDGDSGEVWRWFGKLL